MDLTFEYDKCGTLYVDAPNYGADLDTRAGITTFYCNTFDEGAHRAVVEVHGGFHTLTCESTDLGMALEMLRSLESLYFNAQLTEANRALEQADGFRDIDAIEERNLRDRLRVE